MFIIISLCLRVKGVPNTNHDDSQGIQPILNFRMKLVGTVSRTNIPET